MKTAIVAILMIALGAAWVYHISERPFVEGDDYGDALAAFGLIAVGAIVLVVRCIVFMAVHIRWGW